MLKKLVYSALLFVICIPYTVKANSGVDSVKQQYQEALKVTAKNFSRPFRRDYVLLYSLPEKSFMKQMDSARALFINVLDTYRARLDKAFISDQQLEINYYFNKLLIEYPVNHSIYTGKSVVYNSPVFQSLKHTLPDFNNPAYLLKSDFTDYARSFFAYQTQNELKRPAYKGTDNRQLQAVWKLIPRFVANEKCRLFWQFEYLCNHVDNNGIKNIAVYYNWFVATCTDTLYKRKLTALYKDDEDGRKGHLITTFKTVGATALDMHLFLPDSADNVKKRPVIIYFHGGSWSEGKPDWFFEACKTYAKKGWVACAVEYRTYGRQGTLPFEAVKDARSAIRWLRQHANQYQIDTSRIVASGNSAGGHLALACALAGNYNEVSDDMRYSPCPNIIMVNSAVYDLTDQNTAWIRQSLKDKDEVKAISPAFLVKKNMPPVLFIHGTNDKNVPYTSALQFEKAMREAKNQYQFLPLANAGHFIWYDPQFTGQITAARSAFLSKWGY